MQIGITTSLDYPELCHGFAISRVFGPAMVSHTTHWTHNFRHVDEHACHGLFERTSPYDRRSSVIFLSHITQTELGSICS